MPSAPTTHVLVDSGPDCGRLEPVWAARFTVGRSTSAGVSVNDPALDSHHLLGSGDGPGPDQKWQLGNSSFRLVEVVDGMSDSARAFHRPPLAPMSALVAPVRPNVDEIERRSGIAPNPTMLIATLVSGAVVSLVTRQPALMLMSGVGSGAMLLVWAGSRMRSMRQERRARRENARRHSDFVDAVEKYAHELVRRRRVDHPTMGELLLAARTGSPLMWSRRSIGPVALGREDCVIEPVGDGIDVQVHDSPFVVSLAPAEVVGIHGPRARDVMRVIVARQSVLCGPADWQFIAARDRRDIPVLPAVRREPLDRHDLEASDQESRHRVVLVDDARDVASRASLARRMLAQPRVSMIVIADNKEELPAFCTRLVDSSDPHIDGVGERGLAQFSAALAQWTDPEAEAALVSAVDFDQLHRGDGPTTGALVARIGTADDGPLDIDLVVDGPHALVVGTTGSGKSELLRTMVASMARTHAPSRVNFVLLDYKGGAAFDGLSALPHVVGVVTDLDENLASRVTRGLEAELRRRERLLRDIGATCIDAVMGDQVSKSPPRLVIVVDELATLVRHAPAFVETLLSLVQRGRSLGLHLVLGTQRAAGVVGEAVLANCNLRIALRTQSAADSCDVVGSPRAVRIGRDTPGRAVVRFGHDELVDVQVAMLRGRSIESIAAMWPLNTYEQPHRPWLDPLPHLVEGDDLPDLVGSGMPVAVVDDPDHQCRRTLAIEPHENVLLCGPSGESVRHMVTAITHDDDTLRLDYSNTEKLWRQLNLVESSSRRVTVVVDGLDIWRRLHLVDRFGADQYSRFERLVNSGRCRAVIRSSTDHDVPASLMSTVRHVWRCERHDGPWLVRLDDRVLEARPVRRVSREPLEVETLPAVVDDRLVSPTSVALLAHSLDEVPVEALLGVDGRLALCVIGPRGSGRTRVIMRVATAWSIAFPERSLTVVDDDDVRAGRFDRRPDGDVVVACTPGFLRARSEHWVHEVRRTRSGLLLGASVRDDADLLGIYSVDPHPFGEMPGRGLLIIEGDVVDHVHWATCASPFPPEPRQRSSESTEPHVASWSSPTSSDSAPCSTTS